ncbi:fimbria/pilus outer membrane usher protein [Serratia fonticola]|uniref:fimbria/pilus outer membrane usher protein n=1 Tax=Serratia fonticola TaxID=47917 RepID=UPI001647A4AD|nr:fimbria/pilus outer membrane usher protein [Serratia fonticola]MBC3252454.1 fimbria/pilus outer membrane usher protein [Serratia fonticola]
MKKTPLTLIMASLFFPTAYAEMYFPPGLISSEDGAVADLSRFQSQAGGRQPAGEYLVDVYLNQKLIAAKKIHFSEANEAEIHLRDDVRDKTGLTACLTRKELNDAGVKVSLYPALMAINEHTCISPGKYIPQAFTAFNFQKMRLDISIPQAAMRNTSRGYVEPDQWDEGINAALLNYNFSGSNRFASNYNSNSYFLNLNGGLNLGPWRLRDQRNWNYYDTQYGHQQQWQRINTYVERTVIPLRSNLVMGEGTTGSDIFDSIAFRGVQLSTDDNMYPDTRRGFAPLIRGIAESNAEVTINQNGYSIYKTSVAPGPFEITDLTPVYSSGDLEVTVRNASGRVQVFTVPYASVPMLQREGRIKYSLTTGHLRNRSERYDSPGFAQSTVLWGLPHNVTTYGGTQFSQKYLAAQFGAGINMGEFGALSADITHANSTLPDDSKHHGQSMRFLYAHAFNPTGTTFRLTGYRYSTKGFHTLDETALKSMQGRRYDDEGLDSNGNPVTNNYSDYYNLNNTRRARFEANISQRLGDAGSLYLTGVRQTYWNTDRSNNSLQAGFSSMLGPVNYSLNYGYTRQGNDNGSSYTDHSANLSLSVPLDRLFSMGKNQRSMYATFNGSSDGHGNLSQQAGLSGSMLEGNNLDWNLSQGYTRSQGNAGNASLFYRGGAGNANVGYSYSGDYQQTSYGLSGGAILHRGGMTLGQPLGDTNILLSASGVPDVGIENQPGIQTDWWGYAIQPYAIGYRENRVALNVDTLNERTEADSTVVRVVPTKGAVAKAEFAVRQGYRLLLSMIYQGKPLPFGAVVSSGDNSGIVGDAGQVFLSGMQEKGQVKAKWGNGVNQQCTGEYRLHNELQSAPLAKASVVCR